MRQPGQLDWLLDDLVARVAKVTKAVILSRDGLAIGASGRLYIAGTTASVGRARDAIESLLAGIEGRDQ